VWKQNTGSLPREGLNPEPIAVFHELKALGPRLENHQIAGIHHAACDSFLAWVVAKAALALPPARKMIILAVFAGHRRLIG
jgi:hypothetical protein